MTTRVNQNQLSVKADADVTRWAVGAMASSELPRARCLDIFQIVAVDPFPFLHSRCGDMSKSSSQIH